MDERACETGALHPGLCIISVASAWPERRARLLAACSWAGTCVRAARAPLGPPAWPSLALCRQLGWPFYIGPCRPPGGPRRLERGSPTRLEPGGPRRLERGLQCREERPVVGGTSCGPASPALVQRTSFPSSTPRPAPPPVGQLSWAPGAEPRLGQDCPDQAHLVSEATRARRSFS